MERIDRILKNEAYRKYMEENQLREKTRRFCCHDMEHVLDVARIAWILNLERSLGIAKDVVYAAALLHDVGRWVQYETREKHAAAGIRLAAPILKDCGYESEETEEILRAIAGHSGGVCPKQSSLAILLWESDKESRRCWQCDASEDCGWEPERKNMSLVY